MKNATDPEQFMKMLDKWMRHVRNFHEFKSSEMIVFRREELRNSWERYQDTMNTCAALEVLGQEEQKKGPPLTAEICNSRAQIWDSQAKLCANHARVFESVGECLKAVDNWHEDNRAVFEYKPQG